MSFYGWKPYVPVAKRREQAAKKTAKLQKGGRTLAPIAIEGRAIAKTFWGKSWCQHIESFSDYENRLPRGRTYARNGSILDLQITKGAISALVMGSSLYELTFTIQPLDSSRWAEIKSRSIGRIDSLVELLHGRFSDAVMSVITDSESGLFPSAQEIKKRCSCPDSAGLCKHLAAALYGIGARLDEKPELLFLLRGVDPTELLEGAPTDNTPTGPGGLDSGDLADIFGIEIASTETKTPGKAPIKDSLQKVPAKKAMTPKITPQKKRKKSSTRKPIRQSPVRGST